MRPAPYVSNGLQGDDELRRPILPIENTAIVHPDSLFQSGPVLFRHGAIGLHFAPWLQKLYQEIKPRQFCGHRRVRCQSGPLVTMSMFWEFRTQSRHAQATAFRLHESPPGPLVFRFSFCFASIHFSLQFD